MAYRLDGVAEQVEVVGLGITEHLPWDAIPIRDMLRALPLIGKGRVREMFDFSDDFANSAQATAWQLDEPDDQRLMSDVMRSPSASSSSGPNA
jgi:hypothetical protein